MYEKILQPVKKWHPGCLWAALGGVIGGGLFFILLFMGLLSRASFPIDLSVKPVLTVLVLPSVTPLTATQSIVTYASPLPTITLTQPSSPNDTFEHGQLVAIYGTGGDGLRLRNQPKLDAVICCLGLENEVFMIADGPVANDGYRWWYLVNPYDGIEAGWAVANYLRSIASP